MYGILNYLNPLFVQDLESVSLDMTHEEDEAPMDVPGDAPSGSGMIDPAQADTLVEVYSPPPKPASLGEKEDDLGEKIKLIEPFESILDFHCCTWSF